MAERDRAESALISQLHCLDPSAYRWLVDRFGDRLFRYFYVAHFERDLAQEQAADTVSALVVAFARRRVVPEDIDAYVFGTARNVLRRHWRWRMRGRWRRAVPIEEALEMVDPAPLPDREVECRDALHAALRLLESLSEDARQVVLLRFVEEMELAEVSRVLNMPLGTVKSHIHRARAALKAQAGR